MPGESTCCRQGARSLSAPLPADTLDRWPVEGQADQDRREGGEPRRYVIFQMAEVAIARQMFQEISLAESSKTQVNPNHYAIFLRRSNLYCNAPKEMLF
jgi:hypothetical protein